MGVNLGLKVHENVGRVWGYVKPDARFRGEKRRETTPMGGFVRFGTTKQIDQGRRTAVE
jgi:hypothetical protein